MTDKSNDSIQGVRTYVHVPHEHTTSRFRQHPHCHPVRPLMEERVGGRPYSSDRDVGRTFIV